MRVMMPDAPGAAVSRSRVQPYEFAVMRPLIVGTVLVTLVWLVVLAVVRPRSFWVVSVVLFVPVLFAGVHKRLAERHAAASATSPVASLQES